MLDGAKLRTRAPLKFVPGLNALDRIKARAQLRQRVVRKRSGPSQPLNSSPVDSRDDSHGITAYVRGRLAKPWLQCVRGIANCARQFTIEQALTGRTDICQQRVGDNNERGHLERRQKHVVDGYATNRRGMTFARYGTARRRGYNAYPLMRGNAGKGSVGQNSIKRGARANAIAPLTDIDAKS